MSGSVTFSGQCIVRMKPTNDIRSNANIDFVGSEWIKYVHNKFQIEERIKNIKIAFWQSSGNKLEKLQYLQLFQFVAWTGVDPVSASGGYESVAKKKTIQNLQ